MALKFKENGLADASKSIAAIIEQDNEKSWQTICEDIIKIQIKLSTSRLTI